MIKIKIKTDELEIEIESDKVSTSSEMISFTKECIDKVSDKTKDIIEKRSHERISANL